MTSPHHLPRLEDYEPCVGPGTVERLLGEQYLDLFNSFEAHFRLRQ